MTQRILIDPVTRIEGHAKITLDVDDAGKVVDAHFHVTELRGFEKLCEGRPFEEMPGLMARICGICPVSHSISASKAGDRILGIEVPPAAVAQRRLAMYAQVLQSHALSFFHLSSPDLLLGMDCVPARRNVFGLIEAEPELARRGIRLRQFGQRIIELVGGRRVHPGWSVPGGVSQPFTSDKRDELWVWLAEAYASVEVALGRLEPLFETFADEIEHLGNFPSLHMGLVDDAGQLDFYDGRVRIVDAAGNIVAEALDAGRFETFVGEASLPWSYLKPTFFRPLGFPGGAYRVGPLARLNVAKRTGTPRADKELRIFRQLGAGAVNASFHYHFARLIEMLHAVERIEELLDDKELLGKHVRARALPNRASGVGFAEAPRGILFHHYDVDDTGRVTKANVVIATAQNANAMDAAVLQTAQRFVDGRKPSEEMLNRVEAAIRCFDPCLSCSTHALGRMPLELEVRDRTGAVVSRFTRG